MSAAPATTHPVFAGDLKGHQGWVTSIAVAKNNNGPDVVISGSRDKSIIVWNVTRESPETYGAPHRRLEGHSHFVQDVAISSDGMHAISGSWDGSLRLWNLQTGVCKRRFPGHGKDVLSVAFSPDHRQIASGSRDKTIKVWNTIGQCKGNLAQDGHRDWVSSVRFSPASSGSDEITLVSGGWDKVIKVWDVVKGSLKFNLKGHEGYVNTLTVSPDGSLCASGGKDGKAMLWDITEGRHLDSLDAGEVINALVFSPVCYWLCGATTSSIHIWDLASKVCIDNLKPNLPAPSKESKALPIECISLCWSPDGATLYAGYTDNVIRCFIVK